MGRTILADKRIGQAIEALGALETWAVGLIVGQRTEAKDYAVHLVKTPTALDEAGHDVPKGARLESVDEHWVAVHCKQVLRMLPGGLTIMGIFAVAPPDTMKAAQNKLPQVLTVVHKTVRHFASQTLPVDDISEGVLLQICSLTKKLTCRTYDLADSKSGAKPADWKIQNIQETWIQLDTTMAFNVDFAIPQDKTSNILLKQIQNGLMPSYQNLKNAVAMIDSAFVSGDTTMDSYFATGATKKKGKKQQLSQSQEKMKLNVELFTSLLSNSDIKAPVVEHCGATMSLRGTMCGRAFVHSKLTADTAIKALKQDILRSIQSRIEMLCEDLLQTEEEQDEHILYEMPVRVFCSLSGSSLSVCDYMLQDEGIDDALERCREVAGVTDANDDSLETDVERVPTEEELFEAPKKSDPLLGKSFDTEPSRQSKVKGFIRLAVGGVVAALAAGVSYMYLGQE